MITKEEIIEALKEVMDPELMIDVWSLELIYEVNITGPKIEILMTFTTPLCPYGPQLKEDVKNKILELEGVDEVEITITFNPRWEPSEELRALLGV